MTDRSVEYPSRYQLTLVSGTTYDLTAVPGTITAEGTALNKASLLTDATSALLGLTSSDPTVNEAFTQLMSNIDTAIKKSKPSTFQLYITGRLTIG